MGKSSNWYNFQEEICAYFKSIGTDVKQIKPYKELEQDMI